MMSVRKIMVQSDLTPASLRSVMASLGSVGNPLREGREKRADWAQGLGIKEMADVEDPADLDVLYWVGCAGSYDERNQRVSRAFSRFNRSSSSAVSGNQRSRLESWCQSAGRVFRYCSTV